MTFNIAQNLRTPVIFLAFLVLIEVVSFAYADKVQFSSYTYTGLFSPVFLF